MPNLALAAILTDLERHKTIFDLDKRDFGESLMDIDAECILRQMDDEVDPDGARWAPLSEAYVEFKSKAAPGEPMAVLYGHMKTKEQVSGLRQIAPHTAVMEYGVDEEARQLATWFQEGNSRQPERRFYSLSVEADVRKDRFCQQHMDSLV